MAATGDARWPSLPVADRQDSRDTLQLYTQVVGKVRLANEPLANHWWNSVLYVTARGLTTSLMPHPTGPAFQIDFDLVDHRLAVGTVAGTARYLDLDGRPVADFHAAVVQLLDDLGVGTDIWPVPVEIPGAIPFPDDRVHATDDADAVHRFWLALVEMTRVFKVFGSRFVGKASPVHFFWGAFDLALTRFSGRPAPASGQPQSPMMREAMSHEEISVGFWPGSGSVTEPAFYAYARPEPAGLANAVIAPASASYSRELADFLLPYSAVHAEARPDDAVLDFYQSVYAAAAERGGWDRAALDRPPTEWP